MDADQPKLFREEALNYQKNHWMGKALLIRKVPAFVIVLLACLFIASIIIFITFGEYKRRINVIGEVISFPHPVDIFTPEQGYITKQFVKVGDIIKKGDDLYLIDVDRSTSMGNVSVRTIDALREQVIKTAEIIDKLKKNKLEFINNMNSQIQYYQEAQQQSKALVSDAEKGLAFLKKAMDEYYVFQKKGYVSKDQVNNQRYIFYQQQSTFSSLYNQLLSNTLQVVNLTSDLTTKAIDFDNQILQYESQIEDLKRQLATAEASNSILIKAPINGRVESLAVTVGQMVKSGVDLAQINPSKNAISYLVLWVPNDAIPYIAVGDDVNIRYDAFPFEKFGQFPGKIRSISSVPASVDELSQYKNSPLKLQAEKLSSLSYYKTIIKLKDSSISYKDKKRVLTNGLKVQSTLFLESRPIYQWMLSPIYDIKKSITGPVNE